MAGCLLHRGSRKLTTHLSFSAFAGRNCAIERRVIAEEFLLSVQHNVRAPTARLWALGNAFTAARVHHASLGIEVLLRLGGQAQVAGAIVVSIAIPVVDHFIWPRASVKIPSDMVCVELQVIDHDLAVSRFQTNTRNLTYTHVV